MTSFLSLLIFLAVTAVLSTAISVQQVGKVSERSLRQLQQASHHAQKPPDLNDPMPLKAQEQGFKGKDVQHQDGETKTGDWQKEYGKKPLKPVPAKKSGTNRISSSLVLSSALSTMLA